MCTFFTIDKYYYVFFKCVNKDIIIIMTVLIETNGSKSETIKVT